MPYNEGAIGFSNISYNYWSFSL